ncbi:MAG: aminotransferase class I/II-fold pyridoxal phosphate-dependent enzyme [Spirochaetales bacterium]|nr:aminotransferase class I/II-fold pyridoxal phosphate-dependent enzyme [Spirochaetales bacterium]
MSEIALKLNKDLENTQAGFLLSQLGKRLFFPRGIVAQAAEASEKANVYNATAGMAFDSGNPLISSAMRNMINGMEPDEYITYAPTPGLKPLRELWLEEIKKKNPTLGNAHTSLPIVVPGLTSGISNCADLFLDKDDNIVLPDLYWGNYSLIMNVRKEVNIKTFTFFKDNRINSEGLKQTLIDSAKNGKVTLLLNFPNNPTGYSPTISEAEEIKNAVLEVAKQNIKILVISDDAYFGLFYEEDIFKESMFAHFANLHENILAAKIDGATKEDYSWGLRVGFITFAGRGLTKIHTDALENKLMGSVRSSFSSSSKLSQALILRSLKSDSYSDEKIKFDEIMRLRYLKVKEILEKRTTGLALKEYPFNSGYFMNFKTEPGFNEKLRLALLEVGIGTISLDTSSLRVAYSCIDIDKLEDLYSNIFKVADTLQ